MAEHPSRLHIKRSPAIVITAVVNKGVVVEKKGANDGYY
jgi:hypothetical protein